MAIGDDARLRGILEKVELLTGERSDGSRRAVLISELQGLSQDLSDQYAAIKKSVRELAVEFAQSSASFKEEITVRADENSALAEIVTTLKAKINDNEAAIQDTKRALATKTMALAEHVSSLSAQVGDARANITNIQTVYASDQTVLATDLSRIEATAGKKRSFRQTAAPANNTTNNLIVGDMWFDTDDNNKPYYWSGSAWIDNSDGRFATLATTASVDEEKTSRVAADGALALALLASSVGSARVYWSTSPPGNTVGSLGYPRQTGDVWFDADDNYKVYSWQGSWVDNSAGTYKTGAFATIAQTVSAKLDPGGTLSTQWALVGSLGGAANDVVTLTGIRKSDGSTSPYQLNINSNVTINGGLLVNGSVTVNPDGSSAIAQNAITEGNWGNGTWHADCDVTAKKAYDAFLVIGSYIGGANTQGDILGNGGGVAGNLKFIMDPNGINDQFATIPIRGFMYYKGYQCNLVWNGSSWQNVCSDQYYYTTAATTFMQVVQPSTAGNHTWRVETDNSSSLNQGVRIAVIRLSK